MKFGFFILILTLFTGMARGQVVLQANPLSANYYERLGLTPSASAEEIKKSFKSLAMKYHPDRHPELDRQLFQNINEASQILQDPALRSKYNASLTGVGSFFESKFKPRYTEETMAPEPRGESAPPPGWDEHMNAFWAKTHTYQMNLFRNLVSSFTKSRPYMYGLMNQLDWSPEGTAVKYFEPLAKAFVRGFADLDLTVMESVDFSRAQVKMDAIFFLPQSALFPELMNMLLESPRADYAVSLFTQSHWRQRPEIGHWINQAIKSKSSLVTMALIEKVLPSFNDAARKKLFLKKIITFASDESLDVLSKHFPISDASVDYREELEMLLARRNQQGARIFKELRSIEAGEMCRGIF